MIAVGGFGLIIDPDFNLAELVEPYAKNAIKESFYPQNIAHILYSNISNWSRIFQKAPTKISHILDNAENGYFGIKFESEEVKRLISEINAVSNRLSFSLIISAIIVASSDHSDKCEIFSLGCASSWCSRFLACKHLWDVTCF